MRKLLVLLLFVCSSTFADNVLVVHMNYVGPNVISALQSAGHTVTAVTSEVTDASTLAQYDQVWDTRYNSLSSSASTAYNSFVQQGGFLYLTTENPGCCQNRNNVVATLISNMGGGSGLTIGGTAGQTSNTITQVNETYMTPLNGSTITFAAGSAITNYGDGQWLFKDASGKVGAVMWVGNAGNLAEGYTGTVITVSDVNWIDSTRFTGTNVTALEDIINGIVAGTVEGTISVDGNTGGSIGGISTVQTTRVNDARIRLGNYGSGSNSIYIDQAGNNNTIEITQKGTSGNHIRGIDGASAGVITGDLNTIDIKQGATTSTDSNLIELSIIGSVNDITLYQDRFDSGAEDSSASGSHVMRLSIDGNSNTVNTMQRSEANKAGHFGEITLVGDSNNIDLYQRAETGLIAFIDVTGSSNLINLTQTNTLGDGNHFADITLIGDGHQVNVTQNGSGSHNANISLTNGSAPSTLDLNQSGSTAQSYSLEQTCYTPGGCSATVSQY